MVFDPFAQQIWNFVAVLLNELSQNETFVQQINPCVQLIFLSATEEFLQNN